MSAGDAVPEFNPPGDRRRGHGAGTAADHDRADDPSQECDIGSRKTATGNIPGLIAQARKQLGTLDDLVEGMVDDVTFAVPYLQKTIKYKQIAGKHKKAA
jgi:hypothetical protein